jgi:cell wall-associated NlpC family hydrolase
MMLSTVFLMFALIFPSNMTMEAPMPNKFEAMRQDALAQVGKDYIFGYEVDLDDPDPHAFDCSELAQWLFHRQGRDISDGTWNQETIFSIDIDQPSVVGDMFFMPGHDGIYVGEGQVVEARGARYGVVKTTVDAINRRGGDWRRLPDWIEPIQEVDMARALQTFDTDRGFQILGADNETDESEVKIHFRKGDGGQVLAKTWVYPINGDHYEINNDMINDTDLRVVTIDGRQQRGAFAVQVTHKEQSVPFWAAGFQK